MVLKYLLSNILYHQKFYRMQILGEKLLISEIINNLEYIL